MKLLLLVILFFIGLIMILGFGIIRTLYKLFFGSNKRSSVYGQHQGSESQTQWNNGSKKEKLFSKEEGEYIDFEEIKDDDKNNQKK